MGGALGGPYSPLFLDQTEAQRAKKIIFRDLFPPLSQGLDDRAPPYLKVCIRHCLFFFDC